MDNQPYNHNRRQADQNYPNYPDYRSAQTVNFGSSFHFVFGNPGAYHVTFDGVRPTTGLVPPGRSSVSQSPASSSSSGGSFSNIPNAPRQVNLNQPPRFPGGPFFQQQPQLHHGSANSLYGAQFRPGQIFQPLFTSIPGQEYRQAFPCLENGLNGNGALRPYINSQNHSQSNESDSDDSDDNIPSSAIEYNSHGTGFIYPNTRNHSGVQSRRQH